MAASCYACGAAISPTARFCSECGTATARTCPACGAAVSGRFCSECGTPLAATAVAPAPSLDGVGAAPVAERRITSVLFGDLVGFTPLSESRDAEDVRELLSKYFDTARNLIERFGGVVEKFIGDGVMAVFNRGGDQPDHARRAACAALALQQAFGELVDQHPDWPRMRVGVNSGEAVVREIGGEGHLAYPLVGDTINMGARLEGLAPVGGVLIGSETYEQLPDGAVVEERAGLRVKGKDDAVDAYVLHACPC